jgi:uncharacterized protein YjiS (DUF1127 family)
MAQQSSMQTQQQSLVFFPHQGVSQRHLHNSLAMAQRARSLAIGAAIGRAYNAVAGLITGYLQRQSLRKELMAMDDRILEDIGLTRGDIDSFVSGRTKDAAVEPKVETAEDAPVTKSVLMELVPAKPVMVEAILRRAA